MTFSDDDLKRLKEELPLVDTFGRWLTNGDKLRALLARLERAEALKAKAEKLAEALKKISQTEDLESRELAKQALAEGEEKA